MHCCHLSRPESGDLMARCAVAALPLWSRFEEHNAAVCLKQATAVVSADWGAAQAVSRLDLPATCPAAGFENRRIACRSDPVSGSSSLGRGYLILQVNLGPHCIVVTDSNSVLRHAVEIYSAWIQRRDYVAVRVPQLWP